MNTFSFPEPLQSLIDYVALSPLLQLYAASIVLLGIGMAYEIWSRTVSLSFLKDVPLNMIEKTHPHLPSTDIIVTTFVCLVALLITALQTVTGLTPFDKPAAWIGLGVLFLICGALGLLSETRKKGSYHLVSAFIIGTAFALIIAILRFTFAEPGRLPMALLLSGILLLSVGLVWRTILPLWNRLLSGVALLVFIGWLPFLLSA